VAIPAADADLLGSRLAGLPRYHLVAEIVSPSSRNHDRKVKWLGYAKAGIPFYLLIDRFVRPLTVTLYSQPTSMGYARACSVPGEPGGSTLFIPAPFELLLNTATLPERKR